jgi:hypothetical protein
LVPLGLLKPSLLLLSLLLSLFLSLLLLSLFPCLLLLSLLLSLTLGGKLPLLLEEVALALGEVALVLLALGDQGLLPLREPPLSLGIGDPLLLKLGLPELLFEIGLPREIFAAPLLFHLRTAIDFGLALPLNLGLPLPLKLGFVLPLNLGLALAFDFGFALPLNLGFALPLNLGLAFQFGLSFNLGLAFQFGLAIELCLVFPLALGGLPLRPEPVLALGNFALAVCELPLVRGPVRLESPFPCREGIRGVGLRARTCARHTSNAAALLALAALPLGALTSFLELLPRSTGVGSESEGSGRLPRAPRGVGSNYCETVVVAAGRVLGVWIFGSSSSSWSPAAGMAHGGPGPAHEHTCRRGRRHGRVCGRCGALLPIDMCARVI